MRPRRAADHRPLLIVPVENQVRELDAKLLFASVAAERGHPVVLGSRAFVNFAMPYLGRGVFVAKSMRPRSTLMFGLIRDLGHEVVAWDEESLVRFSSPEYYSWRFSEATFAQISRLFAWGPDDAEMFSAFPGNHGVPVHVTGNPRADMLRAELREFYRPKVDALRSRLGPFILVNTNFAFANAFLDSLQLVRPGSPSGPARVGRIGEGMSLEFAQGMFAHQSAIFEGFRDLVLRLGAWFPRHTIVIRPHPSEDHDLWRRLTAGSPNVQVMHEDNVAPWLMACRVLLHNGCTTAVEAALLGTAAVTYQPVTAECFDYALPNSLSHSARTPDEVREFVAGVLEARIGLVNGETRRRVLDRHLASRSGKLAAERIVDVLEASGCLDAPPPRPRAGRHIAAWVKTNARTLLKFGNMLRRGHWNSAAYHAHRFPEISAAEIDERIARLGRLLGRFEAVRSRRLHRHIFSIGSAS
jgi:surface carbohydrate biosynthesis protein